MNLIRTLPLTIPLYGSPDEYARGPGRLDVSTRFRCFHDYPHSLCEVVTIAFWSISVGTRYIGRDFRCHEKLTVDLGSTKIKFAF
jgi:hypothetical protein